MTVDLVASLRVWSSEQDDVEQFADAVDFEGATVRGNRPGTQWTWRWASPLAADSSLDKQALRVAEQVASCKTDIQRLFRNRADVFIGIMPDEDIALHLSARSIEVLAATGIDVNIDVYPVHELEESEAHEVSAAGGSSVAVENKDEAMLVLELPRGSREWHRLVAAGVEAIEREARPEASREATVVFVLNLGSSSILPFSSVQLSRLRDAHAEIELRLRRPAKT